MPQFLKLVAFCFCLPLPIWLVYVDLSQTPSKLPPPTRDKDGRYVIPNQRRFGPKTEPIVVNGAVAIMLASAVILLIDAFRRDYEGPKAWPIALAVFGLFSFGLTSTIYYAIWGWKPTHAEVATASQFCNECVRESLDRSAKGAWTINGLAGIRFIGAAHRCPACGSSIKTLWAFAVVPVFPLSTYRVLPVGVPTVNKAWFLSRKMPRLNWRQVWPLWMISLVVVGLLVFAVLH